MNNPRSDRELYNIAIQRRLAAGINSRLNTNILIRDDAGSQASVQISDYLGIDTELFYFN